MGTLSPKLASELAFFAYSIREQQRNVPPRLLFVGILKVKIIWLAKLEATCSIKRRDLQR